MGEEPSRTAPSGKVQWAFPPRTQPWEACWAPRPGPRLPKPPLGHVGPGVVGGRLGENRRGRRRDPPVPEEQERHGGHLPPLLEPRKPAGPPGWVPCPPRPEARLGPLCCVEPKTHPHPMQGLFQPCGPKRRSTHRLNPTPA